MLIKKYLERSANISAENRLLRIIVVVIGAAVLFNTFMLFKALNSQKVVLLPPRVESKMEIGSDKASDEYVKSFGRYIVSLAMTYSPATARSQFDELLTMYSPEAFPGAKAKWYDLADTIEAAGQVSSVFYVQRIVIKGNSKEIEVTGLKRQHSSDKQIESRDVTYVIPYVIKDGRFMISDFYERKV